MLPEFAHPSALPLLLVVPVIVWFYVRAPQGGWLFSDQRALPEAGQRRPRRARWGGIILRTLGLSALIVALAGPRWPDAGSRIPTEGVGVGLVLDISASMAEEDFGAEAAKISRFDAARRFLRLLVAGGPTPAGDFAGRPDDLVGLVTFATQPETACPLTLDHQTLLEILDGLEPRTASGEATTNPGDALGWALIGLQQVPARRKAIVFVTDGESNVPEGLKPRQAAQLAGNLGVPIYAIDVAPEKSDGAEAEGARQARASLEAVARLTGGAYFRAGDMASLQQVCTEIDRLEKQVVLGVEYRRYWEGFAWFALAALIAWTAAVALEASWWREAP